MPTESTVPAMIGPEIVPVTGSELALLKLKGDDIFELRMEGSTIKDIVDWMENLETPVFVYDVLEFESYLIEEYMIDVDRLILFTFDTL